MNHCIENMNLCLFRAEYFLSLDGVSTIDEGESGLISDIGLVSGDLVHILPVAQSISKVIQSHSLQSVNRENEE